MVGVERTTVPAASPEEEGDVVVSSVPSPGAPPVKVRDHAAKRLRLGRIRGEGVDSEEEDDMMKTKDLTTDEDVCTTNEVDL